MAAGEGRTSRIHPIINRGRGGKNSFGYGEVACQFCAGPGQSV